MDIGSDLVLKEGDDILLCSDGLSGYVDDREIEAAMNDSLSPQETVNRLINLALQKGGKDNVTVQFVRYGKRSDVHHRDYKDEFKAIFMAILIAGLVGGASFSAYMLVTNDAKEYLASLRETINQKGTEIIQQITKIKGPDEHVAQHEVSVADRSLELANTNLITHNFQPKWQHYN